MEKRMHTQYTEGMTMEAETATTVLKQHSKLFRRRLLVLP